MRRFKDILYIVASESNSKVAFKHAVTLANNNQARLTVVEIIDKIPSTLITDGRTLSTERFREKIIADHQQILQALVVSLEKKTEIQTKVLVGKAFLEIIREVLRNGHDLVIKTAERGDLLDRVFGSDDMHLLRKCPCPVWLVKPNAPQKYRRILAAVDLDDDFSVKETKTKHQLNLQILQMASSLALSEFAELHIVNVWETFGEAVIRSAYVERQEEIIIRYNDEIRKQHQQKLNVLVNEICKKLGQNALDYLKPQLHLLKGFPRKDIPRLASTIEADLVVMGTVARTGISGFFMGNTAETILNQLNCSVLAIKPFGFETPVTLGE